jgi:ATP-dependent Zn protease
LALLQDIDAGAVPPADAQFAVLEGPPGTGKTLIASALANSVGWTFVPTSVSSWFSASSGHLGGVSKAMAEFFDSLVAGDRVLGLLDEIDAIPNRTDLAPQDREWWTPVVTGLLLQIDRLRKSGRKVMLLGATNYYDRLDGALTRGGRLERRIPVLPPQTTAETRNIFAHYLGGQIADEDLDLAARLGRGATHAAIESWSRGAKIKARAEKRPMLAQDLIDQIAPPDNRSIEDLKCTALHEAGHALVSVRLGFEVTHMSLLRSGDADGLTSIEFEGSPKTWSRIQDMITALLAGRAADTALGRGPDSGAGRDLAMATNLLAKAIDRWGLGDALIVSAPQVGRVQIPPHLATKIDSELKAALRRASEMIASEVETVNILADRLTTQRVLSQLEILSIVGSSRQHAKLLPAERISPSH